MTNLFAGGKSVVVLNGDDFVIDLGVQNIGHKASANALDLVGTRLALAQNRAGSRLNSNNLYVGVLLFQVGANAGHGAAGANTGNKNVNLAVGVFPDFGTGGLVMGLRVGGVHKLAGNKAVGDLLGQLVSLGDSALHALGAFSQNQLGTVSLHQLAALHAHGFGHDNDDLIAAGSCHAGQADAGVAGGRLNDGGILVQLAGSFGIVQHCLCNAVLDGTGGIEVFQLSQQLGFQAFGGFNVGELQ